jgi:hypothetical protein
MAVQYAFVANDGEVKNIVSPGQDSDYTEGETYHGLVAYQISIDEDTSEFSKTKYRQDNTWKTREACPGIYYDWINYAWVWNSSNFWKYVRIQRDAKLYSCDWTLMSDSPLSDSKKTEWQTYRQALRNVPATNSSITVLADIVWPTEPT